MRSTAASSAGARAPASIPVYYPDNLPPVVNIGPGSPTGMTFGYGAKFPAKYQDALFMCDWSYGKLYAVHLQAGRLHLSRRRRGIPERHAAAAHGHRHQPQGRRHVLHHRRPQDHVGTLPRHLCRHGIDRAIQGETTGAEARAERKKLESYYLKKDPGAIDAAWPYLGHADRFLRYAARAVLEHQGPARLAGTRLEGNGAASGPGRPPRPGAYRGQEACNRASWKRWRKSTGTELDEPLKQELIRVYELAFIRMGASAAGGREKDDRAP